MYNPFRFACLVLVAAASLLGGCTQHSQRYMMDNRLDKGLVMVFTGIEGRSLFNEAICQGLAEGGVEYAIELVDWTSWTSGVPGPGYLWNQRNESGNRQKAAEIADKIISYRISHPDRPVYLVGQSGGGAMAVWTAETMPFGHKVSGVVCLAASLSPDYPLDEALRKSNKGIINFYSRGDWFFLGLGTQVTGTMDGQHSSSAGRMGFRIPYPDGNKPPAVYMKLRQIAWTEEMIRAGHYGGHLSSGTAEFVREFVAPLILAPQWDQKAIDQVMESAAERRPAKPNRKDRALGLYGRI